MNSPPVPILFSGKDYGEILDGIMPIEKSFGIHRGIIGIAFILLPLNAALNFPYNYFSNN